MSRDFQVWVGITGWYDGDTCYGVLDQGVNVYRAGDISVQLVGGVWQVVLKPWRHRIALIQAPEIGTAGGPAAKAYAEHLAPPGLYRCHTYKDTEEYGRPKIDPILTDGRRFSDAMLAAGMAIPYR